MSLPIDAASAAMLRDAIQTRADIAKTDTGGLEFGAMLKDAVGGVLDQKAEATKATQSLAKGDSNDLHDTLISMEKADISLKFMVNVRNKVLDAYHEIMRMGQ